MPKTPSHAPREPSQQNTLHPSVRDEREVFDRGADGEGSGNENQFATADVGGTHKLAAGHDGAIVSQHGTATWSRDLHGE